MSGPPTYPQQKVFTAEQVAAYQNSPEYLAAANATPPSSDWGDSEDGMSAESGPSTSMSATNENTLNNGHESSDSQQTDGDAMAGESQSLCVEYDQRKYTISRNTYDAKSLSPYASYVHESALAKLEERHEKQVMEQQAKIEELQHEVDTAKAATNSVQSRANRWRDAYLDLNCDRRLGLHRNDKAQQEAFDVYELTDLRQLIELIPGYGFPQAKLKSYLLNTLPEFRKEAKNYAEALTRVRDLEGLLRNTETERDQQAEEVMRLETVNAHLNTDLRKSENLHKAYQNHLLFHPPLGEYKKLKVKISNLKQRIKELEKAIKDKNEELDDADQQIYTANMMMGWPVRRQRPLVLVESEIQSISILPETSSACLPASLVNQPDAPPPHKKTHRGGQKHKKPYSGRKPLRQASQEDAFDDDFIISPVAASASNDSTGVSLHSVDVAEDMEDEVEDGPVDGYPFASWYEPRQETTIKEDEDEEDEVVNNHIATQHPPSQEESPSVSKPSQIRYVFMRLLLFLMLLGPDIHTALVLFGPTAYTTFTGAGLNLPAYNINLHNNVADPPSIISFENDTYNVVNLDSYGQLSQEPIIEVPTNESFVEVPVNENLEEGPGPILVYRLASKLFTANRIPPVSFTQHLRELENTVAPTLEILGRAWGSW